MNQFLDDVSRQYVMIKTFVSLNSIIDETINDSLFDIFSDIGYTSRKYYKFRQVDQLSCFIDGR